MGTIDSPIKLQILSKLEYKSDITESATGILRMVWFPFTDLDLKEFKINSEQIKISHDIQTFLKRYFLMINPALLQSVTV